MIAERHAVKQQAGSARVAAGSVSSVLRRPAVADVRSHEERWIDHQVQGEGWSSMLLIMRAFHD